MKKFLLPAAAVVLAVTAAVVLFAFPKRESRTDSSYAKRTEDGDILISAADLHAGELTVLKFSRDSKIELIATLDEDGEVQAALGTCQSCNGSPGAYYTQNGELLQCNNCGLTFPMSVIGASSGGCHPIMIDEQAVQRGPDSVVINSEALAACEPLFTSVSAH